MFTQIRRRVLTDSIGSNTRLLADDTIKQFTIFQWGQVQKRTNLYFYQIIQLKNSNIYLGIALFKQ